MAISRVASQDAKGTTGSASTLAVAYPGATTAGNLLIASVFSNSLASAGTLDIAGWTKRTTSAVGSAALVLFDKLADGTEATITVTGGSTAIRMHIYEYTGNANPISVDVAPAGTTSAASVSTFPSTSLVTTYADDLLFATWDTGATVSGVAVDSGWSLRQLDTTSMRLFDADLITTATGTYFTNATWTGATNMRAIAVAYKAAANRVAGSLGGGVGGGRTGTFSIGLPFNGGVGVGRILSYTVNLIRNGGVGGGRILTGTVNLIRNGGIGNGRIGTSWLNLLRSGGIGAGRAITLDGSNIPSGYVLARRVFGVVHVPSLYIAGVKRRSNRRVGPGDTCMIPTGEATESAAWDYP